MFESDDIIEEYLLEKLDQLYLIQSKVSVNEDRIIKFMSDKIPQIKKVLKYANSQ